MPRTSEPIPEVPLYKNHGSCYDTSSGCPVVPLSLPFLIHKLPPTRPNTTGSRTAGRRTFAGSAEDLDGRPRTAVTMHFEEEERVRTPALGFQGWYIGKKEGKLGAVNVHTQRISEWESYDQAAATLGSPGAGHHAAPGPPYLEATQDMLEYSEQEKYVYRKHPNLYALRVAEKAAMLSSSSPLKTKGAAKQRALAAAAALPALAAPSSPTSVAFAFDSPGHGSGSGSGSSSGSFDKPAPSHDASSEGLFLSPGDAARLDALLDTFLQHMQQKWPSKFRRHRNIDLVFAGRDLAGCGSLPEPEFQKCLRFVVSADPVPADYAFLVKTFADPDLDGRVSYSTFTRVLYSRDNEPRGIKMSPFPK